MLCQELEKMFLHRNMPLVLCGDFNSLTDSAVYELLSTERCVLIVSHCGLAPVGGFD